MLRHLSSCRRRNAEHLVVADEFPAAVPAPGVAYALMARALPLRPRPPPLAPTAPSAVSAQSSVSAQSADSPQSPGSAD